MNIDSGLILLWNDLTQEQKDSGRWVKLGEGELARAQTIEERDRPARLQEIFGDIPRRSFGPHDFGSGR